MNKPLIYIDQNILNFQIRGEVDLLNGSSEFQWIYSKQHFSEFGKSKKCSEFLCILEEIDARMIELELDERFQIKDTCFIHSSGTPQYHFERYQEAISDIDFDINVLNTPIAWLNGNRDQNALKKYPKQIISELQKMLSKLGLVVENIAGGSDFKSTLIENQKNLASIKEPIEKIREKFGEKHGFSHFSKKDNPLEEIWNRIKDLGPELTAGQFFGFMPYIEEDRIPKYLGIVRCCSVLDVIGFCSEKKSRKISSIPNIQSDAAHIGYGAFCSGFLSGDLRLCQRARAIYRYIGANTIVFPVESGSKPDSGSNS